MSQLRYLHIFFKEQFDMTMPHMQMDEIHCYLQESMLNDITNEDSMN